MATSSSFSSSTSLPTSVNSPQSDWALQLSQMLAAMGQYQYSWALNQFANTNSITDAQIGNFLNTAGMGEGMAANLLGRYQNVFQPLMDRYISEASTYGSTARQNFNAGAAESTQEQAGDAARRGAEQELQSYGIDPSSGRYQDLITANRTATAAAAAGAGTQASINTQAVGRQMLQNAVQMGQQVPGMTVNALNSAYQGISGAENANLGNANAGATLTSTVPPFMNAAASANKLPPVGQTSRSGSASGSGGGSNNSDKGNQGNQNQGAGGRLGSPPEGQLRGVPGLEYQGASKGMGGTINGTPPKEGGDQGGEFGMPLPGEGDPGGEFGPTPGEDQGGGFGGDTTYDYGSGGGDYGGGGGGGGDYGGYAQGGPVHRSPQSGMIPMGHAPRAMTSGGNVPQSASPSQGRQTDDVNARLNAGEFVIPRDVVHDRGTAFFQKLISQSRKLRTGMAGPPARAQMKPSLPGPARFQSQQV